jgi:hypothetical protein
VLLLPCLLTMMMKFPLHISHNALLWFHVVVLLRVLPCTPAFLTFAHPLPLLLSALTLPRKLAADALAGTVNTDLLLYLPQLCACFERGLIEIR